MTRLIFTLVAGSVVVSGGMDTFLQIIDHVETISLTAQSISF